MEEKNKNKNHHSKIYKIVDDNDYFYIGSTTSKRLAEHKSTAKRKHHIPMDI